MADVSTACAPPASVEVIPSATVDALIAGNEGELASLRRDLEDALEEAEVAEARLRDLHGGVLIDDEFEAEVLSHAGRTATEVEHGIEDEIRRMLAGAAMIERAAPRRPQAVTVAPRRAEPVAPPLTPPLTVSAPASIGAMSQSPPPAHTMRSSPGSTLHATAVVPTTAPAVAPAPLPGLHDEFWAEEREAASASWTAKLPTNMLLQVGAVIVIMALILLKLA